MVDGVWDLKKKFNIFEKIVAKNVQNKSNERFLLGLLQHFTKVSKSKLIKFCSDISVFIKLPGEWFEPDFEKGARRFDSSGQHWKLR